MQSMLSRPIRPLSSIIATVESLKALSSRSKF